ncbi:hypothetical protein BJX96DRAFT_148096 [Aspergillus floccosus]
MPTHKNPVSMDIILSKMCRVMRNIPQKTKGSGYVYAFFHPTNGSVCYKIGQTQDPQFREKAHRDGCELKSWKLHQLSQYPIQEYLRVEMLALRQLRNNGCDFGCHCTKQHKEYFIGNKQDGLNTLRLWIDWLEREKPFGDNRLLTPFWEDRVNAVDIRAGNARLRHLFQCHKTECVGRSPTRRGACQACLDAGVDSMDEPHGLGEIRLQLWSGAEHDRLATNPVYYSLLLAGAFPWRTRPCSMSLVCGSNLSYAPWISK